MNVNGPLGCRNDREGYEHREESAAGRSEENRCDGDRYIELPQPRHALLPLRQAQVPRHRKAQRQGHAELVRVDAQAVEPPRVPGGVYARQVVVYGGDRGNRDPQHIRTEQGSGTLG